MHPSTQTKLIMKPTTNSETILHAQQRVDQKWHEFVLAEQQGASQQVLERKYNGYMLAVEELNRCSPPPQIHPHSPKRCRAS
jgi:hypothetical protein